MIACGPPERKKKKGKREKKDAKRREKRDFSEHAVSLNCSHYLTAEKHRNLVTVTSDNQQTVFSVTTQGLFFTKIAIILEPIMQST